MSKIFKRAICSLLIVVTLCAALSIYTKAATINLLNNTLTVTDTQNNITNSNGTLTATANGGRFSQKTNTITFTNNLSSDAMLSFEYSAGNYSSFSLNSASGKYEQKLGAGASISISITGYKSILNNTATLTLSNLSLAAISDSATVTFTYDSAYGSITVGGETVSSGATVNMTADGATLVATVANGGTFVGWVNTADNSILSTSASYAFVPTGNMTVKAVFAGSDTAYWGIGSISSDAWKNGLLSATTNTFYRVSAAYLYDDLNTAISNAVSKGQGGIYLASSGTLPAGTYTIPSSVTLLIPYDSGNTMYTTVPREGAGPANYAVPTAYRTLTMADGANLVINGSMSLSARVNYASNKAREASPTGPVGMVRMQGSSSITVNNGGNLYAWGFITRSVSETDNTAGVTVKNGGAVYECFQFNGYRGGTMSTNMKNGVFPLSQYYVQNIEVPLTLEYGAQEKAFTVIFASDVVVGSTVNFVGTSNSMFNLADGKLIKTYDGTTDRLIIGVNGSATLSSVSLTLSSTSGINSKDYVLPLNNNMTININSGTTTVQQDIALLPSAEVNIAEGATAKLGSGVSLYIYDVDEWGPFVYCESIGPLNGQTQPFDDIPIHPLYYVPGRAAGVERTEDGLVDAAICVNGTLDASVGYIYTTSSGANIYSTGSGQVKTTAGTETVTYQLEQLPNSGDGTYHEILITTAKLKHANGEYLTSASTTYNYNKDHGFWCAGEHGVSENTEKFVDSSCSAVGKQVFECPCGYSYEVEVGKKPHTEVTDAAVAATCTTAGKTEGKHCSVCKEVIVAQEDVPALGHAEVVDAAVAATCTESGLTEGSHCSVCSEVIVAQEEIPALGHTPGKPVIENNVASGCETDGSYDSVVYCTPCGEELSRTKVVVPPTGHPVDGHGCTVCGETIHIDSDSDFVCNFDGCGMKLVKLLSMNANADAETELVLKFQMNSELAGKVDAVVTFGDAVHTDTEVSWNGNQLTVVQPVASAEMTKDLQVTFAAKDGITVDFAIPGTTAKSVERSIVDYARAVLKSEASPEAMDLVTKLVTYGGYAQLYFSTQPGYTDVPTDYLAFNVLTELGLEVPDPSEANITDSMDVPQAFASVKQEVYLDSAISQDVIFGLAEGYSFASQQLTLTYKKTFHGAEDEVTLTMDNGIVRIQNIPAAFLNYDYKLEGQVAGPDGTPIDFEVTPKVTAYLGRIIDLYTAKNIQTPVTKELADLANAMYLYNQSAYAFFNQYSVAAVEETEVTE